MILVFGGGGQLGQELTREACKRNLPLIALTRDEADITLPSSIDAAIQKYSPSLIVNAAAYTNVDQAEDNYEEAYRINAEGPAHLAAACVGANIPLLHVSTDYVFEGSKEAPYVETDEISPINTYGKSKAAGEEVIRRAAPRHVILRTSWVYGEFGRNFLKTILRMARERDELRIVSDQRGCPTSTRDLASAILAMAPVLIRGDARWGTYHYCGAGTTSWFEFAQAIVSLQAPFSGRTPQVIPISTKDYPTRAKRPANSALDCQFFTKVFGVSPSRWMDECVLATRALLKA